MRTRTQASVSNGLELTPIPFCSLSLSKVLRLPAPSSVQQMVQVMAVVVVLMVAIVTGSHHWGR